MKDQVIMGPSGEIAIAVPLFRLASSENIGAMEGYSIQLAPSKPIGYLIDIDSDNCQFIRADVIDGRCEFLGDL